MAEYEPKEVDISFSLLLELMDALKGYGSDVVVAGGWAPYFLLKSFSHATEEHVGPLDADLALNFRGIPEEAYATIFETIRRLGYAQRQNAAGKPIPASFEKTVTVGRVPYAMQVDFLAGESRRKAYVSCNELGVLLPEAPQKLRSLDPPERNQTPLFRYSASQFRLTYICEPRTHEPRMVRRAELSLRCLHRKSGLCGTRLRLWPPLHSVVVLVS